MMIRTFGKKIVGRCCAKVSNRRSCSDYQRSVRSSSSYSFSKTNQNDDNKRTKTQVYCKIAVCLAAAGATGFYCWKKFLSNSNHVTSLEKLAEDLPFEAGARRPDLPNYKYDEVAEHTSEETGIWVIFKEGVYDITKFIKQHPGGDEKISMAIGGSVEPFWDLYSIHLNKHVFEILESLRIGNVHPEEEMQVFKSGDHYAHEPKRHPALKVNSQKPFNAETPLQILVESFYTPNELFFVRNHLPVPKKSKLEDDFQITGIGLDSSISLTMSELKMKYKPHEITTSVMCAGNRRSAMHETKPVKGLQWSAGAVSTAKWKGIKLSDLLKDLGITEDSKACHIIFQGADTDIESKPYEVSIPLEIALDPNREVLLAFEMNGKEIPLDHGYPIRVIVPGVIGARQVKWLKKIIVSEKESDSLWQQKDYKTFNPSLNIETCDTGKAMAVLEFPVQSAICQPANGSVLKLENKKSLEVKGYALSGAGKKILRVDVSVDGGQSWMEADLYTETKTQMNREWAWTLWKLDVPLSDDMLRKQIDITCKATDSAHNTQPESDLGIWNARGLLENKWPKISVKFE
ncbi:hypothetical protein HELRODRAFT_163202 [Helobdella robusta]|uniref:Sulfite oxidase n=1 Tax=Helobdella robusta TaxID=6412 RepID=T1ETS6_HELRO|nr:hypothetical protein HELRODRAFT_163202 [Helobdella robusta]ESN96168.1 hypothetical protein HELRODRAFT_163202 [Helobdella robusta]